jgi:CHAD domain-containing protein
MGQQFEFKLAKDFSAASIAGSDALRAQPAYGVYPLPALFGADSAWRDRKAKRLKAVKAEPALLPKSATAEGAFRLTLMQCKWHIAANFQAVVQARSPEGLHQMRVGFRRLRVALTAFGGEFRTPAIETLRLRAKQISERMAPARDLDVFLKDLFEPAAEADGAKEAFALLRERAKEARRAAWDEAVAQVCAPAFSGFVGELGEAIDHRVWMESPRAKSHAARGLVAFEAPASDVAERMLKYRLAHAKKRARDLDELADDERHKLRIALKKLRYTAEFFAPLYPKKPVKRWLKCLGEMQDILGGLNDVATARQTLEKLVALGDGGPLASKADLSFAAGIVYGWQLERADRIWKDAVGCWDSFSKSTPFWRH